MKILLVVFVISFFLLLEAFLRSVKINTKYVLVAVSAFCAFFLYKGILKERFVDKDLERSFNNEMTYIRANCKKPVELPNKIVIKFDKTGEAIGYCQHYVNGFKIVINAWYWNEYLDALGRHQLLIHEMMHCIFKIRHVEDPKHFMAPEYDYIKPEELDRQVKELLKENC